MNDTNTVLIPTNDFFARYLFANPGNESILLHFLNALREDANEVPFTSVELLDTFNLKENVLERQTVVDVKARTENGELILVEVQNLSNSSFISRILYYIAVNYAKQMLIEKNDFKVDTSSKIDYNKLKPVISVSLLNGTLPLQTKKVHSVYRMKNIETGNELSKDWEVHLIKLGKKVSSENENLKLWIQFFSSKNLEADKMDIIEKNPYFEEVFERYKNFSGDTELMEKYRDIQAYKMYQMEFMNEEKMLSKQEGFDEGLEEGQKIAMRKIANNMLSLGESIEKVKTITGLTEEEIRIINN